MMPNEPSGEDQGPAKRQKTDRAAAGKARDNKEELPSQFDTSLFKGFGLDEMVQEEIEATAEDIQDTIQFQLADPKLFNIAFGKEGDPNSRHYNKSSWDAVSYYKRATANAPKLPPISNAPTKSGTKADKKKVTKVLLEKPEREMRAKITQGTLGYKFPVGEESGKPTTMVGSWPESMNISEAAPKDASYNLEMLNLISQMFLNKIASIEIEAMALNDRLAVSANEIGKAEEIKNQVVHEVINSTSTSKLAGWADIAWATGKHDDLKELRSVLSGGDNERGTDKLISMGVAVNLFPEQVMTLKAALEMIAREETKTYMLANPKNDHSMFTDIKYANGLIAVQSIKDSHAEQNLGLSLLKSKYSKTERVAIAGGKRPCVMCYLSLCLIREEYTNLEFNPHAGGYYIGETSGGLQAIAVARGLDQGAFLARAKHYLGDKDFHSFVTATQEYKNRTEQELEGMKVKDGKLERDAMTRLAGLEGKGLTTRSSTFVLRPEEHYDRNEFGNYDPTQDNPGPEPDEDALMSDVINENSEKENENLRWRETILPVLQSYQLGYAARALDAKDGEEVIMLGDGDFGRVDSVALATALQTVLNKRVSVIKYDSEREHEFI